MADIGGLQLLPETRKKIEIRMPGQNKPLLWALLLLFLVFVAYGVLFFYNQSNMSNIDAIDQQISSIEKSRDRKQEAKLLDFNNQLAVVNPLLANHLIWSDAFVRIQGLVLPQVQFVNLNADYVSHKLVFKALAANYTVVARQIASFYGDAALTDVSLNKISSLPTGRVEMTMQITFDANKFLIKTPTSSK